MTGNINQFNKKQPLTKDFSSNTIIFFSYNWRKSTHTRKQKEEKIRRAKQNYCKVRKHLDFTKMRQKITNTGRKYQTSGKSEETKYLKIQRKLWNVKNNASWDMRNENSNKSELRISVHLRHASIRDLPRLFTLSQTRGDARGLPSADQSQKAALDSFPTWGHSSREISRAKSNSHS